jgi:hypothetical protein
MCIARYLANASLDDLKNIVGLPDDVAKKIASIPPDRRPHSIEDYKGIISEAGLQVLEQRIYSLGAEDFKRLSKSAEARGVNIEW